MGNPREHDPPAIRGVLGASDTAEHEAPQVRAIDADGGNPVATNQHDATAAGEEVRIKAGSGDQVLMAPVGSHGPDPRVPAPGAIPAHEGDPSTVGRPGGRGVSQVVVRQMGRIAPRWRGWEYLQPAAPARRARSPQPG